VRELLEQIQFQIFDADGNIKIKDKNEATTTAIKVFQELKFVFRHFITTNAVKNSK
jgi:hypothetical protein